jgi:hypothetical protein
VRRPAYGHTLDDATVQKIAKAGGLPLNQTVELRQAVNVRRKLVVECETHVEGTAATFDVAAEELRSRVQDLLMAIQITTIRAAVFTSWVVGEPSGGMFFPVHLPRKYRTGRAVVGFATVPVLEELVKVLATSFPQRIGTALVEFHTALTSEDVRRQIIHAVIALRHCLVIRIRGTTYATRFLFERPKSFLN